MKGAGCLWALPCSSLPSVPYAQIKLWGFRSVSLVMSGTTQSFWSCSHACFCQLRDPAWIPNSKQNFAGSVNCQFCQTWQVLLWEICYLLESSLKFFLSILFLLTMILLEKIIYKNVHLFLFCFQKLWRFQVIFIHMFSSILNRWKITPI